MPLLMLSAGMFTALASSIALRSRGLDSGAPPPRRAAIVISLMSFVKRRPRFASAAPFLCLVVLHLLWPDMGAPQIFSCRGRIISADPRRVFRSNTGQIRDGPSVPELLSLL